MKSEGNYNKKNRFRTLENGFSYCEVERIDHWILKTNAFSFLGGLFSSGKPTCPVILSK